MLLKPNFKNIYKQITRLLTPFIFSAILLAAMQVSVVSYGISSAQATVSHLNNSVSPSRVATVIITAPATITETIKLTAFDAAPGDRYGSATAISGDTLAVGAYRDDDNGFANSGSVYIYERHQDGMNNWGFVKKLYANDPSVDARFGSVIIFQGDMLVVGAYGANGITDETGAVYIFERNLGGANNWGLVKKVYADDGQYFDRFSWGGLSIEEDILVVGARGAMMDTGSAYIFERNQGGTNNWGQVIKLTAFDGDPGDWYGISTAVSDNTVVIGARQDSDHGTEAGSAYIYDRNQGGPDNWGLVKKITASNASAGDWFATSVNLRGDTLTVGATVAGANNSGGAYIFERNQGGMNNWGEITYFVPSDGLSGDRYGTPSALEGDRLLIAARFADGVVPDSGMAYLHERNFGGVSNWGEVVKFMASDGQADDEFGGLGVGSIVLSDTIIAIGAPFHDGVAVETGAVYLYLDLYPMIALNKSVTPTLAEPGDAVTYTIRFSNTSGFMATGAILTDIVPAEINNVSYVNSGIMITSTGGTNFTWQLADIPHGSGGIITLTGVVDENLSSEGVITNTAVITPYSSSFVPVSDTVSLEINIPPEIDIVHFYEISEGQSLTLTGTLTDPGTMDNLTLNIDWGDGLSETINYPPGVTALELPHVYVDDDPSVTSVDEYLINMTLSDNDGGFSQNIALATVHNISPTVTIGPDKSILAGTTITFTGSFTDPGILDLFTYAWDFGDGVTTTGTLTPSHLYPNIGTYTVTLTVSDDDSGLGQDTMVVEVYQSKLFLPFVVYK